MECKIAQVCVKACADLQIFIYVYLYFILFIFTFTFTFAWFFFVYLCWFSTTLTHKFEHDLFLLFVIFFVMLVFQFCSAQYTLLSLFVTCFLLSELCPSMF